MVMETHQDVFPKTRMLSFIEFWYRAEGADFGFDPEFAERRCRRPLPAADEERQQPAQPRRRRLVRHPHRVAALDGPGAVATA